MHVLQILPEPNTVSLDFYSQLLPNSNGRMFPLVASNPSEDGPRPFSRKVDSRDRRLRNRSVQPRMRQPAARIHIRHIVQHWIFIRRPSNSNAFGSSSV
jgi:hypothetical protein